MTPRNPTDSLVKLVCPDCRQPIAPVENGWRCEKCRRVYSYRHGILSFLNDADHFNEGEFEEKQKNAWSESAQFRLKIRSNPLLSAINTFRLHCSMSGRRDRVFLKEMSHRSKDQLLLDLGCGGGRHYFAEYGNVIGIDPVLELLPMSKTLYREVYHCGGYATPFADNTFDYIVSSDVLGHIPFEHKDQLFAEMYRILKKGGRTVHLIETDATNVWFRFAHKYPELFQKYLVDVPGHVGLELPSQLRARFLKHGFREIRFAKFSSDIKQIGTLSGIFDNEYKNKSPWIKLAVEVDKLLAKSMLISEPLNFLLEPLAWLDDQLTSIDHGDGMLVVFEK
jgi:ubiquinone/menaquinone biosynthesis C-methylase UbiE